MRVCAESGCPHFANKRGTYCDLHDPRPALYTPAWQRHSRERRASQPYCRECGAAADLTVDHPTDDVLCRSCHLKREAARRRGRGRQISADDDRSNTYAVGKTVSQDKHSGQKGV